MEITSHDWETLLYNFAVVLSGSFIAWRVDFANRFSLLFVSLLFGIFWTAYFRFAMVDRFADHPKIRRDDDAVK